MSARIGVVTFPGSLDDRDACAPSKLPGPKPVALWHGDANLHGVDAVVLPGGFSYGDYLRCGAIARFSPVMESGDRRRPRRDAGPRDLQRISDPVRVTSAARCTDTQRRSKVRLP